MGSLYNVEYSVSTQFLIGGSVRGVEFSGEGCFEGHAAVFSLRLRGCGGGALAVGGGAMAGTVRSGIAETALEELLPHLAELLPLVGGEGGAHVQAEIDGRFLLGQPGGADCLQGLVDCAAVGSRGGEQVLEFQALHRYIGEVLDLGFAEVERLGLDLLRLIVGDAQALAELWIPDQPGQHELATMVAAHSSPVPMAPVAGTVHAVHEHAMLHELAVRSRLRLRGRQGWRRRCIVLAEGQGHSDKKSQDRE